MLPSQLTFLRDHDHYIITDDSIAESPFPNIDDEDFNKGCTDGAVNYLSVACEMASR
jgi:hypothetical protein